MSGRLVRGVGFAVALGFAILSRVRYFDWCIHDDAWISFRYARNLVRGDGLVMNPGERVEGITNLLWTLLAAPVLAVGADPAWTMQFVGAVLALGLMTATWWFAEHRLGGGPWSLVAPALFAFNVAFVMESLSGLETMLFSVLVFAAYTAFLAERRDASRRPGLWAAWCGAATIVRPEGTLLFALLSLWALLGIARGEPAARLGRAALVFAALTAPLVAFRLAYYGVPVPNTFYAKVGFTTEQLSRGWRYTRYAFVFPLTLPMLVVAAAGPAADAVARRRARPRTGAGRRAAGPGPDIPPGWTRLMTGRPRDEAVAVVLLVTFGWLVYVAAVGGDYEPTARFYMPVLALVYIAFQEGLRSLTALFAGTLRHVATVAALLLALVVVTRSSQRVRFVLEQRGWPQQRRAHHDELRAVGEWLHTHTRPGTLIALSSIGALSYFADRPIIDMMGLTDARIGRRHMPNMGSGPAGHEKGDGDYVLSRRPDIILLDKGFLFPDKVPPEEVLRGARGVSELEILRDPRLARDYQLMDTRISAGHFHWLQRQP